ncbi:MAG: hypothetical protein AAF560_31030, partial [Acidobacteriota bacterium]
MNHRIASQQTDFEPRAPRRVDPQGLTSTADDPTSVDDGLRSLQGIRWLLLAGALVVAVSVVRLVAAEWGGLGACARFITLVVGALAVYAAGDVTRHRLRLPIAGSAFLALFAVMVPLLAWGAGYLELLSAPWGWLCLALGLGCLLAATQRLLRNVLGYSGSFYTVVLGSILLALPTVAFLETRSTIAPELFFVLVVVSFGLLLGAACRHINCFFFHRDRRSGVDRPISALPFAALMVVYLAMASRLTAFSTHLALPLVFVALALLDAGEEYYRALVRAAGRRPKHWPRRSVALLVLGFAALGAALWVALLDPGHHSLALVSSLATWRLLAWAVRYRTAWAHGCGLLSGVVAYHAIPALYPEALVQWFESLLVALGFDPKSTATVVGLGDLGLIAALLASAWVLRERLTPAMHKTHAVLTALATSLLLLLSLLEPSVARWAAPAYALLLLAGLFRLVWPLLLPVAYQALVTTAFAWTWPQADRVVGDASWLGRYGLALGLVQLLVLGGGLFAAHRHPQWLRGETRRLLAWPPVGVAIWLVLQTMILPAGHLAVATILTLVAAMSFVLAGCVLGHRWLFGAGTIALTVGLHSAVASATDGSIAALSLVSQGLTLGAWAISRRFAGRSGRSEPTAYALRLAGV